MTDVDRKLDSVLKDRPWITRVLLLLVPVLVVAAVGTLAFRPPANDYVITNVRYLRGDHVTDDEYFVAVRGDKISYIGKSRPSSRRFIDGKSKILAPGFIDTNSMGLIGNPKKLFDGVTTYINAHGDSVGASLRAFGLQSWLNCADTVSILPFEKQLADPSYRLGPALDDALAKGAYGVALSPEYNKDATTAVVLDVCSHFAHKNVPLSFHLRYSDRAHELDGLDEAIACARMGNPVHLLHLSSTGATYNPREALRRIDAAKAAGAELFIDFYPYTTWNSPINKARFSGDWMARYEVDYSKVWVAGDLAQPLTEESFKKLRASTSLGITVDSIPKETLDLFAVETEASIGTDTTGDSPNNHPRGVAAFTTFITKYVDTGRVEFDRALYRFSTLAIQRFARYIPGLRTKGKIEVGYDADLVLWDRSKIKSMATYANPLETSQGVDAAFVNGALLIMDGQLVPNATPPGRFLPGAFARPPGAKL